MAVCWCVDDNDYVCGSTDFCPDCGYCEGHCICFPEDTARAENGWSF